MGVHYTLQFSEEASASVTLTADWAVNALTSGSKEYRNEGVAIE